MRSKDDVRADIWRAMEREGVSRFPGAEGRIPNFAGAKGAAERLSKHSAWQSAEVIKANPDSPQTHARRLALAQGKTLVMAVPRLRDQHPFRLLDPRKLSQEEGREAATIKGAMRHGRVIDLEEVPELDFVLTGSVAVNLKGARIGKGGGYSDLEYALCRQAGLTHEDTPIVTTVHAMQVVPDSAIEMTAHDISLSWYATPEGVVQTAGRYPRPRGILWGELGEKLDEIPVLQRLAQRR
jgi:5-formyltetrahydrofolate cyclo-ligase